ncbi:MAG: aminoacetone oxidase family FAD-binding enzyme [Pedobacter sp.]|nr:MAG: aminoacetone oxidase family FAD-binding enzyme [Pedobacter sp.]
MNKYDAIIIGGGACGLMCAVQAGFLGKKVLILEKNDTPGAKILISGGGRCNFTNLYADTDNFISQNPHFLKSAFNQWTVADTIQFFETYGIQGKEKTLGQLFPDGKKAKDVVQIFSDLLKDLDQNIKCNAEVLAINKQAMSFEVIFNHQNKTKSLLAPKVVMASGGLPISKLGASDLALKVARHFDMPIIETAPALVPLTITGKDENWFAALSGNTIFAEVSCGDQSFEENILFTHWGLSGPAILQISSYWRRGMTINLNLLPNENIGDHLVNSRLTEGGISLHKFLHKFYTKKFCDALTKFLPMDKPIADLNASEIQTLTQTIHEFKVKPAGDKGYDKAEVMRGGIDTSALSSKTLESKIIPGLYFGGECIDVTGWLGGYNFQWAWASGYVIAQNI